MLIITATTFIVQILGPICVKYGVTKAGETGLDVNIDDIMKTAVVNDVKVNGHKVCSPDSYSIVNEDDVVYKIMENFKTHENLNYSVRNAQGKICGQISVQHIKEALQMGEFGSYMLAMDLMDKPALTCTPQTSLTDVYRLFEDYDTSAISIVNEENEPLGILERFVVDHYLHSRVVDLEHKLAEMAWYLLQCFISLRSFNFVF